MASNTYWLLHARHRVLLYFGAVVIDAVTDHRPAVVLALNNDIYFIATFRPMLLFPQLALSIKCKTFGVANTIGPYLAPRPGLSDKRIVSRNGTIGLNTNNLAKRVGKILGGRSHIVGVIAERNE